MVFPGNGEATAATPGIIISAANKDTTVPPSKTTTVIAIITITITTKKIKYQQLQLLAVMLISIVIMIRTSAVIRSTELELMIVIATPMIRNTEREVRHSRWY